MTHLNDTLAQEALSVRIAAIEQHDLKNRGHNNVRTELK